MTLTVHSDNAHCATLLCTLSSGHIFSLSFIWMNETEAIPTKVLTGSVFLNQRQESVNWGGNMDFFWNQPNIKLHLYIFFLTLPPKFYYKFHPHYEEVGLENSSLSASFLTVIHYPNNI